MTKEDIGAWVVDVLHDMFEIDKASITPQANLYTDLDIDSIDAVDLVVKLKQFTGKRLQPDVFKSVRTVQDVVDAVVALLAEDTK
ncbi:acyl carrier protein [Glaciimonas sp. CA11.2]|uniref:acyl carrier protein n=1 Tax=unclassified Glaciimonas TaxID=2644401 RepID=UPI002AB572E0|nr:MULTISPECIES: acyl carrier protein [unclassified Glaciimonas]MDY7547627.1 acyl carrier protein [Glaciimonas sp. CA11.2]MEB0013053.1 acyl carrier protein [Glaciimonas sp. Cout2]MEB0083620.1 acyl carrier protein [Glaciimonas sp. Gout2]MEB0161567.1 acyl carrier protein [Glaciimonas sp. CA11.2]